MRRTPRGLLAVSAVVIAITIPLQQAAAQAARGSGNTTLVAHVPLGGAGHGPVVFDPDRPFVYAARNGDQAGIDILDLSDLPKPARVGRWNASSPRTIADMTLFRDGDTVVLAIGSQAGLEFIDVGDPATPEGTSVGGTDPVHAVFAYHRGDGARHLFVAVRDVIEVRDLSNPQSITATIPLPGDARGTERRFRGLYAQYDLASDTDRLYAAGTGGYTAYDVTDLDDITEAAAVRSAAVQVGVGIQAASDGSHIVTTANYPTAPVRIFDLRPALDGTIPAVRTAAGAWTDDWKQRAERFEVRWPYLFVAAGSEGLRMVNIRNAFEPYTTAWFYTYDGPAGVGPRGAVDVDVRNSDGLIAVSDETTGLWILRVEDFRGWDGRGWGVPNLSSVQNWDAAPVTSDRWN